MKKNPSISLQTYLTGLGALSVLASTSNAAVISIDVSAFAGPNGGIAPGANAIIPLFTIGGFPEASIGISNGSGEYNVIGFTGQRVPNNPYTLSTHSYFMMTDDWLPKRFNAGEAIGDSTKFGNALFNYPYRPEPDWEAGSFLGFRVQHLSVTPGVTTVATYYGWLEVTWDQGQKEFHILSGAYESTPGMAIMTPIPEPSSLVMLVAGAAGVAALRRRKKAV